MSFRDISRILDRDTLVYLRIRNADGAPCRALLRDLDT